MRFSINWQQYYVKNRWNAFCLHCDRWVSRWGKTIRCLWKNWFWRCKRKRAKHLPNSRTSKCDGCPNFVQFWISSISFISVRDSNTCSTSCWPSRITMWIKFRNTILRWLNTCARSWKRYSSMANTWRLWILRSTISWMWINVVNGGLWARPGRAASEILAERPHRTRREKTPINSASNCWNWLESNAWIPMNGAMFFVCWWAPR